MTNTNWTTDARPFKAIVREGLLHNVPPRSSALFLPGNGCECVKKAKELGVVHQGTIVHAIECDPGTIIPMQVALSKLIRDPIVHSGRLHRYVPRTRLDYAMVDLLGCLDEEIAGWLSEICENHVAPDFEMSIIVANNWRNSVFMTKCQKALSGQYADYMTKMMADEELNRNYRNAAVYMGLLKSIFHNFDFDFGSKYVYRDSNTLMFAVSLRNFVKSNTPSWPSIQALLSNNGRKNSMKANTLNATIKERQAEAGRKSWETRRANERARKLAEAGRKSWETRRANGWQPKAKQP